MEARGATSSPALGSKRLPTWLLGGLPLALIVVALGAFALLGDQTLPERAGPPLEELAVEQTILRPGSIAIAVRNTGPDAVEIAQVAVNDQFVDFAAGAREIGRLEAQTLTLDYPWQEGSPYNVSLLTSAGGTIEHEIPLAVATPEPGGGFFALMALLGVYVGVIPVALGMLLLPFLRRIDPGWVRFFLALTVGLLGYLALDGLLEGLELGQGSAGAFGGAGLVLLGAGLAYLLLTGLDRFMATRRERAATAGASAFRLSLMIAVGIGLHNLGEGLAIGSAYAIGSLALGAFLVIGFALHNTTEGLAIVAPLTDSRPSLPRLALLGLIAGAPAILGAVIGAAAFNAELAALLIGVGVGAIVQVIQQIAPTLRDSLGRVLQPLSVGGILTGIAIMYTTGLLVTA